MSPRSGKIRRIVVIILALAICGGAAYLAVSRRALGRAGGARLGDRAKLDRPKPAEVVLTYVDIGAFLVNVIAPDRLRYLRTDIMLGVSTLTKGSQPKGEGKEQAAKLSLADEARARDVVVRVLSRQSFDRLRATGPDAELSRTLAAELATTLRDTKVQLVLFTSFVMQ